MFFVELILYCLFYTICLAVCLYAHTDIVWSFFIGSVIGVIGYEYMKDKI
jgi:hypothetical protein